MGRSRRTKRSNRRLPTTSVYSRTPVTIAPSRFGTALLDDIFRPLSRSHRSLSKAIKIADKQFRKEFADPHSRWILRKAAFKLASRPLQAAPSAGVCVQRQSRKEVIHALGHAGKAGQKSPVWTKKSKVRC